MLDKITVKEFAESAYCPAGQAAYFKSKLCTDYAGFVSAVHRAIDSAVAKMCENRNFLQDLKENQLTLHITSALTHMGFDAKLDANSNGHCDVSVNDPRGYQWLGEAKIHKNDYDWLYDGYLQLTTRYASGSKDQDNGGLIIYCYMSRADLMMTRWLDHLTKKVSSISAAVCPVNNRCSITEDMILAYGVKYKVRHIPVALFHDPVV
ncbi:hypothetical protein ABNQ39_06960 [Azospirillum sp. A26]|uniref:hypothetical protein n=1 Tax=Azospirillum sp. A26 TaxID=3160607 RepID=UPI00366AD530